VHTLLLASYRGGPDPVTVAGDRIAEEVGMRRRSGYDQIARAILATAMIPTALAAYAAAPWTGAAGPRTGH
jgi:hypothetical protein